MSTQPNTLSTQHQQRGRTGLSRRQDNSTVPSLLSDPLEAFVNPFSLLRRMQQEVSRVFSDSSLGRAGDPTTAIWIPPIEVNYRDNIFVISAELPGVDDEDIQVTITDDAVIIRGERQYEKEQDEEGGIRRTELRYGEFYRTIPLPDGANPEQARAELRNGVLEIAVPVSESKKGVRQIPVQTSNSTPRSQSGSTQPSGQGQAKTESTGSEKAA
jgi:HSP20 family protein